MELEQIKQIAKNHSPQFGKFNELTGIYKELPASFLGESKLQIIGYDKVNSRLKQLGYIEKSSSIYSDITVSYHIYTAFGYEELIQFMLNPKSYVEDIPEYDDVQEYNRDNQHYYNILRYLLEFSLHYGIKFE